MSEAVAMLELAERLSQAERTIEALLAGQIDAVVDSASNTPVLLAKAQHALRKSEELYRRERDRAGRFLDAAEVILLAKDEYGSITLINRYGAELLGWSTEDLIGKSWPETCIPVRLREAVRKEYAGILLGGGGISEHEVLLRSGGERLIKWRNRVLTDEGGNVTGAFMCGTDITDEKRASDSLRAAEETMRFALEAGGLGIWDMNFKTGEMRWSKILEAQYGIPPGKFEGTLEAFIEAVHPDDRAQVIASLTEANRSGVDFKMANRALRPDGSVRWLEGAGRVQLDTDGRPSRGVGVSHDVTEQTILATQFQQSQKMEAVGRLASGVAHDFNNLLTVILGFADLMTSDISPASEHGNDLAEIIKAAQRASGLTKQLLAFSRQQVLNAAHVDVNRLISEMTRMLERLIGEDIKIVVKLHSEVPHALVDNGQFEQVVMNLVVNARDAMPTGGVITIETGTVAPAAESRRRDDSRESYVTLSVTDTGEGMSKETERRLFEPFFTTKASGKGTGLGLSTTYGIVKQSKGYIEVATELGKGTTFKVFLPIAETLAQAVLATAERHKNAELASGTILLVDDEAGVRQLAQRILEKAGYRVLEAANGDDATFAYAQNKDSIDLVVTDMIMPVCGGPELVRRLRSHNPLLRVLYMSGYSEDSDEEQAARDSGSPFVQKPFTATELLARVGEALAAP